MSLGVISLCQPQSNTAGTILENFFPGFKALVLARGSFVQFFKFDSNEPELYSEYQCFGEIVRVVPLRHPNDQKCNLLILCSDYRFCVLRYNNEIVTVQNGSFNCSSGVDIDPPFRVFTNPYAILIQTTTNALQFYRISHDSRLRSPYTCTVPCKKILCAGFMQIDDNFARIVVLFKGFNKRILQVFELDDNQQIFTPKPKFVTTTERDAYFIRVMDDLTVIVFATSTARMVHFLVTSTPHIISSTIYTESPIVTMVKLRETLFFAIDAKNQIQLIDIPDSGIVSVKRAGELCVPAELCKVNNDEVLCIGRSGKTLLATVSHDPFPQNITVESIFSGPGAIRKVIPVDKSEVAVLLSGRYAGRLTREVELSEFAKIPLQQINGVWLLQSDVMCVSVADSTFVMKILENGLEPYSIDGISSETRTLCLGKVDDSVIQVTPTFIQYNGNVIEFGETAVAASIDKDSCIVALPSKVVVYSAGELLTELEIPNISKVAISESYISICSWSEKKVGIFNKKGEEIRSIEDIDAVSISFVDDNTLVVVFERDDVLLHNIDKNINRKIHCNGFHTNARKLECGLLVSGDVPVILSHNGVQIFGKKPCLYCSIFGDLAATADSEGILLSKISHSTPEVRTNLYNDKILDAIATPSSQLFVICTVSLNEETKKPIKHLCVSENPLIYKIEEDSIVLPNEKYIGMASLQSNDGRYLVAVAMEKNLILYELIHGMLEKRSQMELKIPPFNVCAFGDLFLVASQTILQLFAPAPISKSFVDLNPVAQYQTLGATCCISCDEDEICIGDELQSVLHIHYDRKQKVFEVCERSSLLMAVTNIIIRKDKGIFCTDDNGYLYRLVARNLRNYLAIELEIAETYNIGCNATSIVESGNRIIIGTENGQLIGIVQVKNEDVPFLDSLSFKFISLGNLTSGSYRRVLFNDHVWPCSSMRNLDLATLFLKLPEETKSVIAISFNTDPASMDKSCKSILESAYV